MYMRCKNNLCVVQTARLLSADRLFLTLLKLVSHRAHPLRSEGYLGRVSPGWRDRCLRERLHLEALDLGQGLAPAIRLRALAARPHHGFVADLRPSVVQVRARFAEPPQRRSIRRTRPPRPGRRIRRLVADRGWSSRTRQRGGVPPEQHNPAPGGGGKKTSRGAGGRIGSSKGRRVRQADHPRYR
jgi:hypothetical protein